MKQLIPITLGILFFGSSGLASAIKTGSTPFYLANQYLETGLVNVNDKKVPFVRSVALNKVANVIGLSNVMVHGKPFNEILMPDAVISRVDSIGNLKETHIGHWADVVQFRVPQENYPYFISVIQAHSLPITEIKKGEIGGTGYTLYKLDYE